MISDTTQKIAERMLTAALGTAPSARQINRAAAVLDPWIIEGTCTMHMDTALLQSSRYPEEFERITVDRMAMNIFSGMLDDHRDQMVSREPVDLPPDFYLSGVKRTKLTVRVLRDDT